MEEDYEEEAPLQLSKPRGGIELSRTKHSPFLSRRRISGTIALALRLLYFRKRIEQRKKRKLEKEFALYGGALASTGSGADENEENNEEYEEREPTASVSGTTMYDSGNMTVNVTTSEISREEDEDLASEKAHLTTLRSIGNGVCREHNLPVNKSKPFKRGGRHRARVPSKRDRNKGKIRNKKMHC